MTAPDTPAVLISGEEADSDEGSDEDSAGDGAFALFSAVRGTGAALPFTPIIPPNERPLTSKKRPNGWRAVSTRSNSALKTWKRKKNERRGLAPLL